MVSNENTPYTFDSLCCGREKWANKHYDVSNIMFGKEILLQRDKYAQILNQISNGNGIFTDRYQVTVTEITRRMHNGQH